MLIYTYSYKTGIKDESKITHFAEITKHFPTLHNKLGVKMRNVKYKSLSYLKDMLYS